MTILLLIGSASAATLTVDESGGADYERIQDAIDAARDGDTILVYSGTYYENVNINKQLVLRGIDSGGGKPVVDAGGRDSAILLSAGDSTLDGFTAINAGNMQNIEGAAGISVESKNNIIRNNTALSNEEGIRVEDSSNNMVSDNTATNNYLGIYLHYSNKNTVNDNTVSNNIGAGIYLWYSNNNIIAGNYVSNNSIDIDESSNYNIFYQNNIVNNYYNVHDDGTNQWDNGINMGNYWSDYTGTDANNDGIGDTPYVISSSVKDGYPLMARYGELTVTSAFYDDFSGSTLNSGWIVINKNGDSNISLTGTGILRMKASPMNGGSDYYYDSNYNALRILQPVSGDGIIETKIIFSPTNNYQGAGIIVCYEDAPDSDTCDRVAERAFYPREGGSVVRSGGSFEDYTNSTTYFRVVKKGTNYAGWYSSDGINWILNGEGTTSRQIKYAGLFAVRQPWDDDTNVYSVVDIDHFIITPLAPAPAPKHSVNYIDAARIITALAIFLISLAIVYFGTILFKAAKNRIHEEKLIQRIDELIDDVKRKELYNNELRNKLIEINKELIYKESYGASYKSYFFAVALVLGVLLGIIVLAPSLTNEAEIVKPTPTPKPIIETPSDFTNSIGMEFMFIPTGEFEMGSPSNEKYRESDEGQVHRVKIANAFYMGRYEVTQKQWREVMGTNPSYFKGDDLPVESVSWSDVQEFIKKLNEKDGTNKYRLPSEAEWEYAARASTTTRYSFEDDESKHGDYGWYYENSAGKTHSVGQKKPNPWGLYDVHGNVMEWVQDIYHNSYEGAPADGSAWEVDGSDRVYRGGSWHSSDRHYRSASRYENYPGYSDYMLGFRLVMDAPDSTNTITIIQPSKVTPTISPAPVVTLVAPEVTPTVTPSPVVTPVADQKNFTTSMEFVQIPAGEFDMGSDEKGRYNDEKPAHRVKITKAFYIGKYEVTQKQWHEIMGTNPSYFKGDNLPVESVSWNDVQKFIKKLNEKEGTDKYRLPSETEWEYAARAGTITQYSFGDDESKLSEYAWYDGNSGSKTHEVGQKNPNSWGLYDMHGNVWEWVQDIYHDSYHGAPTDGSAWKGSGFGRVNRGGSWNVGAVNHRSAYRLHDDPSSRYYDLGFRLAKDL